MLAFTGSYLSLFVPLGMPVLAKVGYGGDQALLLETIEGTTPAEDGPASISDLDAMFERCSSAIRDIAAANGDSGLGARGFDGHARYGAA